MYEKQNFKPGQKLKAAQLNHMEEGIADVTEFANDINKDVSEVYKTRNYIFTGSYTNVGGQYQAAPDTNYSWKNLVSAVRAGRCVACVLFDDDKLLPLIFFAGKVSVEDGYVILHSDGENAKRMELYVYENGQMDLRVILDTYTFTGTYTGDEGRYDVAFDSSYSWSKLVNAVSANQCVTCTLIDKDGNKLYMILTENLLGNDEYVVFTANVESTRVWKMTVSSGGAGLYAESFAPQSDSGGVTIDLLWENHEVATGSVNAMGEFNVHIPKLYDYDIIEIHHVTDDRRSGSNRFAIHVLDGFGGILTTNYDDWNARHFRIAHVNGIQSLCFEDAELACVPVLIYGIKGVRSASALQTCRVNAETSDLISFERGMTWGEWCDSPYNAFEDPYYISDGKLKNGAGSTILNPSGSAVSSSDYIGVGVVYHGD